MRFPSLVLLTLLLAAPVMAAENKIVIINKDGSKTEFSLPDHPAPVKVEPETKMERILREEQRERPQQQVAPAPQVKEEPAPAPAKEIAPVKEAAPAKEVEPEPVAEAPQETEEKPAAPAATETAYDFPVPLPGRKPPVPYRAKIEAKAEPLPMAPGGVITRDAALRIALDAAPPASRFNVMPGLYKDRRVYKVTFVTDNGPKEIMVDAENGKILK